MVAWESWDHDVDGARRRFRVGGGKSCAVWLTVVTSGQVAVANAAMEAVDAQGQAARRGTHGARVRRSGQDSHPGRVDEAQPSEGNRARTES